MADSEVRAVMATEGKVTRYANWCLASHGHDLSPHEQGDWVKWTDYDRLLAERDAMERDAAKWAARAEHEHARVRHLSDALLKAQDKQMDDAIDSARKEGTCAHMRKQATEQGVEDEN